MEGTIHEYWIRHNEHYGNFADPEIAQLIKIHDHYVAAGDDPEVWSEDDWQEFERHRLAFERHHNQEQDSISVSFFQNTFCHSTYRHNRVRLEEKA